MKKQLLNVALLAALTIGFTACNNETAETEEITMEDSTMTTTPIQEEGVMVGGAMMVPSKDIVDNAVNSSEHTTLVAAVQTAGLVETLKSAGPFTVFAPTNAAFEALPAGTVDNLLKPENKSKLTSVLTYHVVPGSYRASDLTDGMMLKTAQGEELKVSVKEGKVMINGANVTVADVISSNGVTHVIDAVVLPKKM